MVRGDQLRRDRTLSLATYIILCSYVFSVFEILTLLFNGTDIAGQLTESNKGKHHIGDFLPPEELEKFMEKVKAIQEECDPGK